MNDIVYYSAILSNSKADCYRQTTQYIDRNQNSNGPYSWVYLYMDGCRISLKMHRIKMML